MNGMPQGHLFRRVYYARRGRPATWLQVKDVDKMDGVTRVVDLRGRMGHNESGDREASGAPRYELAKALSDTGELVSLPGVRGGLLFEGKEGRMRRIASSQARERWAELLGSVAYGGEEFLIERNGKPMAKLIPAPRLSPDERWSLRWQEGRVKRVERFKVEMGQDGEAPD